VVSLAQEREACFNAAAVTSAICRGASSGRKNTAPGIVRQPRLPKLSPDRGHSRHRTKDPAPRRTWRARRCGYKRDLALIHSNPDDGGQGPSHCEGNKLATSSTVMIFPNVGESSLPSHPSGGSVSSIFVRASPRASALPSPQIAAYC
jgi:hypothetical protein